MSQEWGTYPVESDSGQENETLNIFIHGIILQFAMLAISFVLFFTLDLAFFGLDFGTVFGLLLLEIVLSIVFLGFANSKISERLWDTRPKNTFMSFLGQGLLILIMSFVLFPVISFVPVLFLPIGIIIGFFFVIPLFLVAAFFNGHIGRHIAPEFEMTRAKTEELASVRDRHEKCPQCGRYFSTGSATVSVSGYYICPHCQRESVRSGRPPDFEF